MNTANFLKLFHNLSEEVSEIKKLQVNTLNILENQTHFQREKSNPSLPGGLQILESIST